jgi:hypothetical protein
MPKSFLAIGQCLLGNSKLLGSVTFNLRGLLAKNLGLSFGLSQLKVENDESTDNNNRGNPANVESRSFHPISVDAYRYFFGTVLIEFLLLTTRIATELAYGRGWFYRGLGWCYFRLGGRRLSQFWEWTLTA